VVQRGKAKTETTEKRKIKTKEKKHRDNETDFIIKEQGNK